ncbi:glycosyltransferase family 2 protein [Marinivivus vitaminiproducens]|uniref:glycosyltransferase family 2 protein n=1 Tax=Marinivivus vitaminiproducens TaxID=3035935 RepID=UPI0027A0FC6B|nr:glycosyltransferase family 2 protein [Geminicoccaceae bacterium SCSIO 64248]
MAQEEGERQGPKISVVIPTFNRSVQVGRAIACVLSQTHENVEVIVVDDASAEDIGQVVASLRDERIVYLRNETNKGGGFSRARGAMAATGAYVAFLDSDDWWAETKLEVQLEAARRSGDRNTVFLCRSTMLYGGDVIADIPTRVMPEAMSVADFLYCHRGFAQTSTMFLPAELAKRVTFDPDLRVNQDTDFMMRLEDAGARFVQLPQSLSFFDCSPSSDRVSYNPALVERAEAWYRSRSSSWSHQAKCGFYLADLTARAANAKRRSLALRYFVQGIHPGLGLRLHLWLLAYIVAGKPPPRIASLKSAVSTRVSDSWRLARQRLKLARGGGRLFGTGVIAMGALAEFVLQLAPLGLPG